MLTPEDKRFLESLVKDAVSAIQTNSVFREWRKDRQEKELMDSVNKQIDEAHRETKTYDTGDPWSREGGIDQQ